MTPRTDAHSEPPPPAPRRACTPEPRVKRKRSAAGPAKDTPATARTPDLPAPGVFVPTGPVWHGITWEDVPGKDVATQKLNFTLLKRGMLRGHQGCSRLHGEALKQRLREICQARRNENGISGRKKQAQQLRIARMKATPRRRPP